jgi:hypothetical protein
MRDFEMTKDADRLRKLKALAARNSGATDGERKAAQRMIKEAERRVLLAEITMGTSGWDDPANRAYYLALRKEQEEFSKKIKSFANKMVKQSGPNHKTSIKAKWKLRMGPFGHLTEFLDMVMLNRHYWQ